MGVGRGSIPGVPRRQCMVPELLRPLTSADPSTRCTRCSSRVTTCSTTMRWKGWICPRPTSLTDYRPSHQRPIQVHLSPSFLLQPFHLTITRLKLSIRANPILLWPLFQIYQIYISRYLYQQNLLNSQGDPNSGARVWLIMYFCPLDCTCMCATLLKVQSTARGNGEWPQMRRLQIPLY